MAAANEMSDTQASNPDPNLSPFSISNHLLNKDLRLAPDVLGSGDRDVFHHLPYVVAA